MNFWMNAPEYKSEETEKSVRQIHSWLYQLNEKLRYAFSHLDEENLSGEAARALSDVRALRAKADALEESLSLCATRAQLESAVSPAAWEALSTMNITPWTAGEAPRIKNQNGIVFIEGGVKMNASLPNKTARQIAALSARDTPARTVNMPGISDDGLVRLAALPTGSFVIYSQTGANLATTRYVSITCAYAV